MWIQNRFDTSLDVDVYKWMLSSIPIEVEVDAELYKHRICMGRGWILWIKKVEKLYNPCSENKDTDQLRSIVQKYSPGVG